MEDCLFCKIINKEIPSDIVYEDERIIAFKDIEPQAPFHVLVIPKKHYGSILDVPNDDDIVSYVYQICVKLTKDAGISANGFRVVNNCGEDGGQTVHHLHFHLLGGRYLQWPPG